MNKDREKLIDIKNQIIEHLNKEEIEEPIESPIPIIEGTDACFGWVKGVIDTPDLKRIYFEQRGGGDTPSFPQTRYIDIVDGEFTEPKAINFPDRLSVFYHNGWGGFRGTPDGMEFFNSPDGINFQSIGVKFQGKMDTEASIVFRPGGVRMFGRADRTKWEKDPDEWRRGISYHKAKRIDSQWESRPHHTDPMDHFDYNVLKPDFYQPSFRADGSGEVVVFWRDEKNVFQQGDKRRLTGSIYPIKAKYENSKISLISHEPAFDLSHFIRGEKSYGDITVYEVGQIYTHPNSITYKGNTYRVISWREEEHYRDPKGKKCGIYLVK